MAKELTLDAMIKRADFWERGTSGVQDSATSATRATSITFENLRSDSSFVLNLRKPDFQRETNQWCVNQAISFIQSFIEGELVPSVILWQSEEGFIFVIDGAHRVSALRAWIEDDYGDGKLSIDFFNGNITDEQKKIAQSMRNQVEKTVGSYKQLTDKLRARAANPSVVFDDLTNKRLKNISSRQLELQWVTGDADVAEISFFKINTQGTPLHPTEEELLRNRHKSLAIAARSIVRAAAGHKYWSKFDDSVKKEIEQLSTQINSLLFSPELATPIKTLALPLGGASSNLEALSLLIKLLSITDSTLQKKRPNMSDYIEDCDGQKTIDTLRNCKKVIEYITGNEKRSLGLHPIVYFYSDKGKYLPDLFLGVVYWLKLKLLNNDKIFFKKFTVNRIYIEKFLIENKGVLPSVISSIYSKNRINKISQMLDYICNSSPNDITLEGMAKSIGLKGSIVDLHEKTEGKEFSQKSKSEIFISEQIKNAPRCPICGGLMEPSLSVSYDHIIRKQDGGTGESANGQLCHPYCNSGFKS